MEFASIIGRFFILALLVSQPLLALAKSTTTTFGSRSCEEWNQAKRSAALAAPIELKWVAVATGNAWLAGYLTAYNENYSTQGDLLDLVDFRVAEDWVDAYCQKSPKNSVRMAVHELFRKLEKVPKQ